MREAPATRRRSALCKECEVPIPETQARRTYEEFEAPLCETCETKRNAEIYAGQITPIPPEIMDPDPEPVQALQVPAVLSRNSGEHIPEVQQPFKIYESDKRGIIYQGPEGVLPPGAVPIGYFRPGQDQECLSLFYMEHGQPLPRLSEEELKALQEKAKASLEDPNYQRIVSTIKRDRDARKREFWKRKREAQSSQAPTDPADSQAPEKLGIF